ncbi:hypothetical protein [Massilia pseudoviolaceinigra]|uniref:hypothetical protein n=1 Tax=Massilia pseudoviolaceinigra TaxID=3057165 RepID=UPI0027967070|nr:hypothetical protein [Massilia sp. CCM 9206]MDQ1921291.1 hypothetical protein [Massilia sp. CCM 9206]
MKIELTDALKAARLYIEGEALPTKLQALDIIGRALDSAASVQPYVEPVPRSGSSTRYCPACEQQRVVPDAPAARSNTIIPKSDIRQDNWLAHAASGAQVDCYCGGWDDATGAYYQEGCPEPAASGAALTDAQIDAIWEKVPRGADSLEGICRDFARAVIAAQPASTETAAVAWYMRRDKWDSNFLVLDAEEKAFHEARGCTVLRTFVDAASTAAKAAEPIVWTDANQICQVPPAGWNCTRTAGHDGPCAAHQDEPDHELDADDHACIAPGMARIKAAADVRKAALEEAAVLCGEIHSDYRDKYKGRGRHAPNNPGRANPYYDGMSDGASECEDAIRSLNNKG